MCARRGGGGGVEKELSLSFFFNFHFLHVFGFYLQMAALPLYQIFGK